MEKTIKRYNFFHKRETISEISSEYENISINNLNSINIYAYEKYIFLSCKIQNPENINDKNKPKQTNEHSIVQFLHNKIITNYYHVFNRNLISFCIRKINKEPYVFSIGCDFKYVQVGNDRTFMTVYSIKIFPINTTTHTINDESFLKNLKNINLIKNIDTGEIMTSNNFIINSEPISEINSFDVDYDGNQIVIGCINGEILLIKDYNKDGIKNINNNSNNNDNKESNIHYDISYLMKATKLDITNVKFSRTVKNEKIIYVTTESEIIYYLLNKNTNIYEFNFIFNDNGCIKNVFDVNGITNKAIFCSPNNYFLSEINNFDRGGCWLIEGKKTKIRLFNENMIFTNDNNLIVYDPINKCIIYDSKCFCGENEKLKVIDFYSLSNKNIIYIVIERLTFKEENDLFETNKEIIVLKEISSSQKLEQFYKINEYSAAENYVKHKSNLYDVNLSLAEIALKKGDHFYTKGEYKKAINEYKKTILHISPSLIIEKFLDTSKLEFLIMFLEELNNNIDFNMIVSEEERKNYIILLLYCYLRGKKEVKMNEFIQKAYLNKQLVIIRAAINTCKLNNLKELALQIVEKGNIVELKIEVLIDIFNNYKEALNLLKKCDNYLFQYLILARHYFTFIQNEKKLFIEVFVNFFRHFTSIKIGNEDLSNNNKLYKEKFNQITYMNVLNILTDDSFNDIKTQMIDVILSHDKEYPIDIIRIKIEILINKYNSIQDEKQKRDTEEEIIGILKNKNICKKLDKNYLSVLFQTSNFQEGILILNAINDDKVNLLNYYMDNNMYNKIIAVTDEFGTMDHNYYIRILNYFINQYNEKGEEDFESYIKVLLNKINDKGYMNPNIIKDVSTKLKNKIKFSLLKPYILNIMKENNNSFQSTLKEKYKIQNDLDTMKKEIDLLRNKIIFPIPRICLSCREAIRTEEDIICYGCRHTFHKRCLMAHVERDEDKLECLNCKDKNIQLGQALKQREELKDKYNSYFLELKAEHNNKKLDLFAKYLGKGIFDVND